MGQWANTHQLFVVENLLEGIKEMLPDKYRLHYSTVILYATENEKIAVPHNTKNVSQQNEENIGVWVGSICSVFVGFVGLVTCWWSG